MRKNSTNGLMTLNFWRMCIANLLLFASAYMLFPVLSFVMPEQVGISLPQTGTIFLAFAAAMFAVGPFHAFLCDEYKRKNVLLYSTLIMLAATAGYVFADSYAKLLLLASVQGACFGLATTAGITVAIDITASTIIVRFLWLPYGCLSGCCRRGFQHVFSFEGICRFSCAYRYEVVWHGPFPAAACMGSGAEHAADCFCSGGIVALIVHRRLHCAFSIGDIGMPDNAFHKDVCEAVAPLPKRYGQYDVLFGYGNGTSGWACNRLPVGRCISALSCCRRSYHTRVFFLRTIDLSLL